MKGEDIKEVVAAFREKRAPRCKGKQRLPFQALPAGMP